MLEPHEDSMLGNERCDYKTAERGKCRPERRSRFHVEPPALDIRRTIVPDTPWLHLVSDIVERQFIQRSLLLLHFDAKVNQIHPARAAHNVQSIHPGAYYVTIRAAVRIQRGSEHFLC